MLLDCLGNKKNKYVEPLIIKPTAVKKIHNYYLGVFVKNRSQDINKEEYIEVKKAVSGSAIEDYFPLFINSFNKRGNWNFLSTETVLKDHPLNFSLTNCSKILTNSAINYRFLLDSDVHYLSNKTEFYKKFKDYDFIINFESISKCNIDEKKDILSKKFSGKPVILKPDTGSVSRGILTIKEYDFDTVKAHISDSTAFGSWSISEIFIPKIINGYIVTNRIYFLVTKINGDHIISYFYKEFMNYRTGTKFTGDISNPAEMLTNLYDDDEEFVRTRFIPHNDWLSSFKKYQIDQIYAKITSIFAIITNTIKNDLMCFNDNSIKGDKAGFHIYGIDAMVDDNCEVRILEVNGAPAMNNKTRLYSVPHRIDYFDLIEEVVQIVIDPIYKPKKNVHKQHKFIEAFNSKITKNSCLPLYYVPISIVSKYRFINNALKKRSWMRRTKNFNDKIDLFYGLRERYVTPYTNMNYYDEIINYKMSKRMRNAAVINKIQGITYFLASKDGLYKQLLKSIGEKETHLFHPHSIFVYHNTNKDLQLYLKQSIENMDHVKIWIAKPVHGSRGLGIKIFHKGDTLVDDLYNYIKECSTVGFKVIDNSIRNFNGVDVAVYKQQVFKYWMICEYINNPMLLETYNPNKKFNIRFYALVTMKKVPTLDNINTFSGEEEVLSLYIFNDMMVYFTVLDYNGKVPTEYENIDPQLLHDMRHLTNLEVINKMAAIGFDTTDLRKKSTTMLSSIVSAEEFKSIYEKGKDMIIKTIESTKYNLRPLNRFAEKYNGCFNLLAYDTMLDDNGKLWLIEVNRGPDLMGLLENVGEKVCEDMFDEIFNVSVDVLYNKDKKNLKLFKEYDIEYNVAEI